MNKHFLSRRQFNALCASVGLSLPTAGGDRVFVDSKVEPKKAQGHTSACSRDASPSSRPIGVLSNTSVFAADAPTRTLKLRNGAVVPAVGQGSWHLGLGRHPAARCAQVFRSA